MADTPFGGGAGGSGIADAKLGEAQTQANSLVDPAIFIATIHDVFSHTNAYILRIPGGAARMGTLIGGVSATPLGARELCHLQIGDSVICCEIPQLRYVLILGVLPPQLFDPRFVLPDSLVMRSMVGIMQDQMHYSPYQNDKNNLANFSGGRPIDTLQGDWGFINELGVAVWLGKLMAQMRASDVAKLEMFWGDDLVRLFGWNFELFTGGREQRCYDDEGEYVEIERMTPYVWESLGSYKVNPDAVFEDNEGDAGGCKRGNEKCRYEPKEETGVMVFRSQSLKGYIGNGIKEQIVITPVDAEGISTPDDGELYRGLSEIHRDLDGSLALRSAKQVILEKSLILPVPRQLLDPDAPDGDTGSGDSPNYNPAGVYGTGTQERKPYEWDGDADSERGDARNTDGWDYCAYLFGKYGLAVLDDHKKDWTVPEADELEIDSSKKSEIDSELFASALEFKFYRKMPKYGEIVIDKRDGHKVRYYQTRSCVHLADDGSVIIEDGYGSQIHMSGGNIHTTCQGDIFNRPGRSAITWAPRDIINKAGWCNELSASKGDIRVKGENNVHMLAGDETKGCLLLECRASGTPSKSDWTGKTGTDVESKGIVFKAEQSSIASFSKNIFVGTHESDDGVVEINAGRSGRLIMSADRIGSEALSQFGVIIGRGNEDGIQFNMEGNETRIVSKVNVVGNIGLWQGSAGSGNLTMDGTIHSARNGLFAGLVQAQQVEAESLINGNSEHVGTGGEGPIEPESEGGSVDNSAKVFKQAVYTEFDNVTIANSSIGLGTQSLQDAIGFTFRTSEQYKTDDDSFVVFESRWQQLYRVNGALKQWDEPEVQGPGGSGETTMPHPGKDTWEAGSRYKYANSPVNIDMKTGVAKGRDEQTESEGALTAGSFKSNYVINVQE